MQKLLVKILFSLLLAFITSAYGAQKIQTWQTPEGAHVFFTQANELPIVDIKLIFDAASKRDGEKFGIGAITNAMIGKGSKHHNEEQIIDKFSAIGAEFSTSSAKEMAFISLRILSSDEILIDGIALLSEVVSKPEFKISVLERIKKNYLAYIQTEFERPGALAKRAFEAEIFQNHPYAHRTTGTRQTLNTLTLDDVATHYKKYYVARNLTIALVGNISRTKAKYITRRLSHHLEIGSKPAPLKLVKPHLVLKSKHISFPSKQSHLLLGQVGIKRGHPDYYALYLGNHILGGSVLTSRLGNIIREQNGLAYSVYSYFLPLEANGYFLLNLQTKNSQLTKAKNLSLEVINNFLQHGISKTELEDAKDNIIGSFPLRIASNKKMLNYLSIIGFYDLPLDYLQTFPEKIAKLSMQEVVAAMRKLIKPERFLMVSVGGKS